MPEETDKEVGRRAAEELASAIYHDRWPVAAELLDGLQRLFRRRQQCERARAALREVTLASQERRTPDA